MGMVVKSSSVASIRASMVQKWRASKSATSAPTWRLPVITPQQAAKKVRIRG